MEVIVFTSQSQTINNTYPRSSVELKSARLRNERSLVRIQPWVPNVQQNFHETSTKNALGLLDVNVENLHCYCVYVVVDR